MDDLETGKSTLTNKERTTSMFRMYSIGTVASNKERNSEYIEVTPMEQLPMVNGDISQAPNEYKAAAADKSGMAYEENITVGATVKAKWRSIGNSNRMTPPDVRRGEEVILYQFSDADEYFWDTMNNHIGIRKLETVVYAWSATKDESDNEPSEKNCYVLDLSTHDGYIKLTTSKANQEPYAYTVHIDTKGGRIEISDDVDNKLTLDSKAKHWRMQNTAGSFIEIVDKTINMKAADAINLETKAYSNKTSTVYVKGEKTYEGNAQHTGNYNIAGGLSVGAGSEGGGGTGTFSGSLNVTNTVTASDCIGGGVSLKSHRHANSGGNGVGGVPI